MLSLYVLPSLTLLFVVFIALGFLNIGLPMLLLCCSDSLFSTCTKRFMVHYLPCPLFGDIGDGGVEGQFLEGGVVVFGLSWVD